MFKKVDNSYLEHIKKEYNVPSLVHMIELSWFKDILVEYLETTYSKNIYRFSKDGAFFYVFNTNFSSSLKLIENFFSRDKYLSYQLLKELGVDTPITYLLEDFVGQLDKKYVCKPRFGSKGRGVNFFEGNFDVKSFDEEMIIQDYCLGFDLRIHVVGKKIFAACVREPASVTGDGRLSIGELIDIKNVFKLNHNRIKKDETTIKFLEDRNLNMNTILEKGVKTYLSSLSNVSLGGDVLDVTDLIDSSYNTLITKLADNFKGRNFAVDCIVNDYTKSCFEGYAKVIEINSPGMWYHHLIAEPNGRDVGEAILEDWLANPEFY